MRFCTMPAGLPFQSWLDWNVPGQYFLLYLLYTYQENNIREGLEKDLLQDFWEEYEVELFLIFKFSITCLNDKGCESEVAQSCLTLCNHMDCM